MIEPFPFSLWLEGHWASRYIPSDFMFPLGIKPENVRVVGMMSQALFCFSEENDYKIFVEFLDLQGLRILPVWAPKKAA